MAPSSQVKEPPRKPGRFKAAYDANIRDYLHYLTDEAAKVGYTLTTDHGDSIEYSIHAPSHDDKQAAHDWLATLPDIWNWIP